MKEGKDSYDGPDDLSRPVKVSILVQTVLSSTPFETEENHGPTLPLLPWNGVPQKNRRERGNVCPPVIPVEKDMAVWMMKGE